MYIGIIAEGKSDLAVIRNILKGKIQFDSSNIAFLQPELDFDETDLHNMSKEQFSNWELVKQACVEKNKLINFFSVEEERYIILQIDTAEAEKINYEVERPEKHANPDYSSVLRNNKHNDPKDELNRVLNRKLSKKDKNKILKCDNELEKFDKLSEKFRKAKYLVKYVNLNESLKDFCDSLEKIKVE